jgi:uncharacterized sulfatase
MITRMDGEIGRILDLLSELELDDRTLVLFTSDNGPSWVGGVDREFFDSTAGLRGRKAQLREGGIRVPLIAWWPGRAPAGEVSDHVSSFADYMVTFADLLGLSLPVETDGVSFLPSLAGRDVEQSPVPWLYWEFHGAQAVRFGDWKAFRERSDAPLELYDLSSDPYETTNLAAARPELVAEAETILADARTESALFPLIIEGEQR